jgi:ApbE superfamily uncharacterized protein (UPF0280 family)
MSAVRMQLAPGRWHFQHGPIDLIIEALGHADAVAAAFERAWLRFGSVLTELVGELPLLRRPVSTGLCPLHGPVARRMWDACSPFRPAFVTPMAAVAGSVAQEIVSAFARDGVDRAFVNNGGDIALWLAPGARIRVAVCRVEQAAAFASSRGQGGEYLDIDTTSPVRGIATSGWRGRSLSLGIADAVTVTAATAAQADAAATMIGNAVNCEDPGIERQPACALQDASDLGELLVTTRVGPLAPAVVDAALDRGELLARRLLEQGLIVSALLALQGKSRIVSRQ